MKQIIKPRNYNIAIEPIKSDSSESLSLIKPEDSKTPVLKATVIAFGPKITDLNVGDLVTYRPINATEIMINNKKILLVNDIDTTSIITEE